MTNAIETNNTSGRNFTIPEAATFLRVSRASIYRLIAQKKIRPLKICNRTIITGGELAKLVAQPVP